MRLHCVLKCLQRISCYTTIMFDDFNLNTDLLPNVFLYNTVEPVSLVDLITYIYPFELDIKTANLS